jgi:hypothetical protein
MDKIKIGNFEVSIDKNLKLARNVKDVLKEQFKKQFKSIYTKPYVTGYLRYGSRNGIRIAENTIGRYVFGVPGTRGNIIIKHKHIEETENQSILKISIYLPVEAPIEAIVALKTIIDEFNKGTVNITTKYAEDKKAYYTRKYKKKEVTV